MTIPVVLHQAPHEKTAVERLVRYCRELDGNEIQVFSFTEPAGLRYPANANWSFRQVAKEMRGQPFIWLEADSPPLVAGWADKLTKEYKKVGKPYLYAKQFNPPHDRFSGIGIQGPNAYDQQPEEPWSGGGFDEWVCVNCPEEVGRTDLIRHSYGLYDAMGQVQHHEFPRDMHIIGKEAVIFHPDKKLQLCDIVMPGKDYSIKTHHVTSVGDLGDCVVSLPTIKHKGGVTTYFLRDNGQTKGIVNRAHIIRPLLEAQPYIECVKIWRNENVDWASEGFRPKWHDSIKNLAECHAQHAIDQGFIDSMPDLSLPWLIVDADAGLEERVILNRSARYQNAGFPWKQVVSHYGSRCLFVGMPEEHADFCRQFGTVEYRPTKDMLEVAKIIAGSALFIGNQSAAMTIAEGLKHPRIQESCSPIPDCIYPSSANAQYVADGKVLLPDVSGSGEFQVKRYMPYPPSPHEAPPGGWQYPGLPNGYMSLNPQVASLRKMDRSLSYEEAEKRIMDFNVERIPRFFDKSRIDTQYSRFRLAMQQHGYPTP